MANDKFECTFDSCCSGKCCAFMEGDTLTVCAYLHVSSMVLDEKRG
jgi:hypothetical protein